jgi:hypothetical protein
LGKDLIDGVPNVNDFRLGSDSDLPGANRPSLRCLVRTSHGVFRIRGTEGRRHPLRKHALVAAVVCAIAGSAAAQSATSGPIVTNPSAGATSEPLRNAPPAPPTAAGQKPVEIPIHRLPQTKQEHVHEMGQTVMPFDLDKTTHIFRMTDSGGIQSVLAKDTQDQDQIALIRQHLRHEAEAFQHGNYSDPTTLHGKTMPGVSELESHHGSITVAYSELPLGAALTFKSRDRHLVTEIHRWFGAQLSEHGADARAQ